MSRMGELDQQKKEAIDKLKGERLELVEAIKGLEFEANKVEVNELLQKISIFDDQIHTIDPSQV